MPLLLPIKMSQFENVTSLSTASYIVGLDMYAGNLSNVRIQSSLLSSSYALTAENLISSSSINVNSITASGINVDTLHVRVVTSSITLVSGSLTASGSFDVYGNATVTGSLTVATGNGNNDSTTITSNKITITDPFGLTSTGLAMSGSNSAARGQIFVNIAGMRVQTTGTSGKLFLGTIGDSSAITIDSTGNSGVGKGAGINAKLDVNGNAIISGSLTVTGAIRSKTNDVYNVKDYGAVGDGTTNDTNAILLAISASQANGNGTVYFPDGTFKITGSLTLPANPQCDIALVGDGSNVSVIKQTANVNAVEFNMETNGANDQQYQVAIRDLGFKCSGAVSGSIYVTYGATSTSSHQNISVDINDVHVFSDSSNYFSKGIVLESAWNFRITNTMVVGRPLGAFYEGTGLEIRRMCVNGSIEQSQFNFWNTGIFVNTFDYSSAGMNTEGLFIDQVYMVPVVYGLYVRGNKNFSTPPFNSLDWANRYIAGRMVLLTVNGSHIDSRNSGSALLLENVQSHYITNNLFITDNTGSVIYGSNAHEGTISGNTLFNAGTAPSIYVGGYSGSANIITGNIFRGGSTHVLLESSSIYNKVYGNVAYNQLSISVTDSGTSNLVGSVGN